MTNRRLAISHTWQCVEPPWTSFSDGVIGPELLQRATRCYAIRPLPPFAVRYCFRPFFPSPDVRLRASRHLIIFSLCSTMTLQETRVSYTIIDSTNTVTCIAFWKTTATIKPASTPLDLATDWMLDERYASSASESFSTSDGTQLVLIMDLLKRNIFAPDFASCFVYIIA